MTSAWGGSADSPSYVCSAPYPGYLKHHDESSKSWRNTIMLRWSCAEATVYKAGNEYLVK